MSSKIYRSGNGSLMVCHRRQTAIYDRGRRRKVLGNVQGDGEFPVKKFAEMTGMIQYLEDNTVAYVGDNGTGLEVFFHIMD